MTRRLLFELVRGCSIALYLLDFFNVLNDNSDSELMRRTAVEVRNEKISARSASKRTDLMLVLSLAVDDRLKHICQDSPQLDSMSSSSYPATLPRILPRTRVSLDVIAQHKL